MCALAYRSWAFHGLSCDRVPRLVQAGVPSRGVLAAKAEKVCYNLRTTYWQQSSIKDLGWHLAPGSRMTVTLPSQLAH